MRNKLLQKKILVTLAAGTLLYNSHAWAAEDIFQLDQVTVTATRIDQPVATVAADVTIITAEQIEAKGAKNLGDALAGITGITLAHKGGPSNKTIVYLNGTERVLVLVDGKRMNLPQGLADGALNVDINNIDVSQNIKKIEVIRGGSSVLYGSDAIGGIINIITKKGTANKTSLSSEFGNYGMRGRAINSQGIDNGFSWYLTGTIESADGQRVNSDYKNNNWTARFDKEIAAGKSISLSYDFANNRGADPGVYKNGKAEYLNNHTYDRNNFGLEYKVTNDSREQVWRFYNNEQNRFMTANGTNYQNDNTVRSLEYQGTKKVGSYHLISWGAERRSEQVTNHFDKYNEKQTVTAAYLQDQYALTSKTTVTGGLRYESNSKYGSELIPKLSLVYNADNTTSYFANWGRVFKTPLFDDVYTPQIVYPGYTYEATVYPGYAVGGNLNLKPETGWTAETGVKKKLSANSVASISFFYRDLKDMIRWSSQFDASNNQYTYLPINIDHAITSGLNASIQMTLSPAISSIVSYTYINEHNRIQDAFIPPSKMLSVGVTIKKNKFKQTINGRYIGDSISGTGSYRKNVGSYFVVDTAVNYKLNDKQSIFATVNNLFNKQYETYAYYPAQERSYTLGFKQTF